MEIPASPPEGALAGGYFDNDHSAAEYDSGPAAAGETHTPSLSPAGDDARSPSEPDGTQAASAPSDVSPHRASPLHDNVSRTDAHIGRNGSGGGSSVGDGIRTAQPSPREDSGSEPSDVFMSAMRAAAKSASGGRSRRDTATGVPVAPRGPGVGQSPPAGREQPGRHDSSLHGSPSGSQSDGGGYDTDQSSPGADAGAGVVPQPAADRRDAGDGGQGGPTVGVAGPDGHRELVAAPGWSWAGTLGDTFAAAADELSASHAAGEPRRDYDGSATRAWDEDDPPQAAADEGLEWHASHVTPSTSASWHRAAAKAKALSTAQAAEAASLYRRCQDLTAMLEDLGAAAERLGDNEASMLALQEENSELASALVEAQARRNDAARQAADAKQQLERVQRELSAKHTTIQRLEERAETAAQRVGELLDDVRDLRGQRNQLRLKYAAARSVVRAVSGDPDGVGSGDTGSEGSHADSDGGTLDGDDESVSVAEGEEGAGATVTAQSAAEALETLGVPSLAAAAQYGNLAALQHRAQQAEEALGNACRRAVEVAQELSDTQEQLGTASLQLREYKDQLEVAADERAEVEAALDEAMRETARWKDVAESLKVDLRNAGHIIGDLSSELEARARLREQLDASMSRIKAVAIVLDPRGVEFITHTMRKLQSSTNVDKEHHFKTAHNVLKKVVVDVLGERPPGVAWRIGDEAKFLRNIPSHMYYTLHKRLQELVISYDNMSEDTKSNLTTAREVVANARTLLAMGKYIRAQLTLNPMNKSSRTRARTSQGSGGKRKPKWIGSNSQRRLTVPEFVAHPSPRSRASASSAAGAERASPGQTRRRTTRSSGRRRTTGSASSNTAAAASPRAGSDTRASATRGAPSPGESASAAAVVARVLATGARVVEGNGRASSAGLVAEVVSEDDSEVDSDD